MKPLFILMLAGLLPGALPGQTFSFPQFTKSGRVTDFVPARWNIKDSVYGDLNRDNRADLVLVLEYADTVREMRSGGMDNTAHPRILLILFKDSVTGEYMPVCQNNKLVVRSGEGGMVDDPYGGIRISKYVLTLHIEYVRSSTDYKFRWQKGDMFLIGFSTAGVSGDVEEDWDLNLSTGKAEHTTGKSGKNKKQWKTFTIPEGGIRLRKMEDPYTIEIMKSVFI